jgi:Domain of Unknown Function (DUF1080)
MKIEVVNLSYTVSINEEKVNDFVGDKLETGYIGLQSHDDESKVAFRNITVKEIF